MWLCVLEIINTMMGTLFIILIVEVKRHTMVCLDRGSGVGEV